MRPLQVRARLRHEVVVDVDGDDLPRFADDMRQERCIVAGGGTDLQDPLAWAQIQQLQHPAHRAGLRRGADHPPILLFDHDDFIAVRLLDWHTGHEQVAGDRAESRFNLGAADLTRGDERIDQGLVKRDGGTRVTHISTRFHRDLL